MVAPTLGRSGRSRSAGRTQRVDIPSAASMSELVTRHNGEEPEVTLCTIVQDVITAWHAEPRTTRGGQPWYSALAILTALTLRAVFRLGLRQTEGLIGSVLRLLGLELAVPDHTTLSRRAGTLEVPRPRPGTGPVHLLVDSTGLRLSGPGEWLVEKHGTSSAGRARPGVHEVCRRAARVMLHCGMDGADQRW